MLYTPEKLHQLQQIIKDLCPQWGLDAHAPLTLLNVSENATFIHGALDADAQNKRIIRVYRPFYHDDTEIMSELSWMQSLEKENIAPLPHVFAIHTKPEKTLFTSTTLDNISWRFVVFSYIEGKHPHINNDLSEWFEKLGNISARLHLQAQNWQPALGFSRKHWTYETMIGDNAYWGDWKKIPHMSSNDFNILQLCTEALKTVEQTFPRDDANFGLIHGDLRLANLLIHKEQLCILDFDDCGFSWYAADLANALSFMEDNSCLPTLIQSWFKGYAQIHTPSKTMQKMVTHLIMMRRIQLSAWLISHDDRSPSPDIAKSFHQTTVKLAQDYLEKRFIFQENEEIDFNA